MDNSEHTAMGGAETIDQDFPVCHHAASCTSWSAVHRRPIHTLWAFPQDDMMYDDDERISG